jgi:hypothetical protein
MVALADVLVGAPDRLPLIRPFKSDNTTGASAMGRAEISLRVIQDIGGWSTLRMPERYAHPSGAEMSRVVGVLTSSTTGTKTGTAPKDGKALKVLSRDDLSRPQDLVDLRALLRVASATELARARGSLALIAARGYHRSRDLMSEMDALFPLAP